MIKVIIEEVTDCCSCPFVRREGNSGATVDYFTYSCSAPGFPDGDITDEEEQALDDNCGFYSSDEAADNKGFDVYKEIHSNCPLPDKEE